MSSCNSAVTARWVRRRLEGVSGLANTELCQCLAPNWAEMCSFQHKSRHWFLAVSPTRCSSSSFLSCILTKYLQKQVKTLPTPKPIMNVPLLPEQICWFPNTAAGADWKTSIACYISGAGDAKKLFSHTAFKYMLRCYQTAWLSTSDHLLQWWWRQDVSMTVLLAISARCVCAEFRGIVKGQCSCQTNDFACVYWK